MAAVQIHIFQGSQTELTPAMCMYCARPLDEDDFQHVPVLIGDTARPIAMPICSHCPVSGTLRPDQAGAAVNAVAMGAAFGVIGVALAHKIQKQQEGTRTTVTFQNAHSQFAAELNRLRNLTPREYDTLMEKANQKFLAKIAAGTGTKGRSAEELAEFEQRKEHDEAMFGMENAAGTGTVSVEVTKDNRNKFLLYALVVGVLSVMLVSCIGASVFAYIIISRNRAPQEAAGKKKADLPPPKEQAARIKELDIDGSAVKLLIGTGKTQIFLIDADTQVLDPAGKRLSGVDALKGHIDADVTILMTDDRQGLQWLRLSAK